MSAGPDMGAYNTATNLMGQGAGMIGQGADTLGAAQGMYGQGTGLVGRGADVLGQAQGMYGQGTGLVGQGSGLYGLGTQMTGQAANMFAPGAAQQFYNPYESRVIDDTLERMRKTSAQQDIAGRAQDISSGAFGGSRGRLLAGERQSESERGILEALSGIRSQGYQQAQQAAQTAGQGIGTLAGQLGQFGQGLGTLGGQLGQFGQGLTSTGGQYGQLGGQLGQFGQGLTSTGGQYGQLGTQIGQLGTGVAGLGQQKSGELANYSNLLNALGTQGQTTQQGGLSRLYQAAQQRAGEPWDRAMRGMNVLGGMKPGELIGGYETKVLPAQTYQQPTSAGSTIEGIGGILGLGSSIADIGQTFGWWGSPDPSKAAGGFIEKQPRDYNAGGIVSGIVPINMATGGDAEIEGIETVDPSKRQIIWDYVKENPWATGLDAAAILALVIPGVRSVAGSRLATSGLGRLLFGGTKVAATTKTIKGVKAVQSASRKGGPLGDGWWPVTSTQGKAILAGKTATTPGLLGRARTLMGKLKYPAILGTAGAAAHLWPEGEEPVKKEIDADAQLIRDRERSERLAQEKNKRDRKEVMKDIVRTTSRLGDMMNAPGTRQTTYADAANIFAQEQMGIPQSDQARELEELSAMSGYSPKEIMDMTDLSLGKTPSFDRSSLQQQYIAKAYAQYGADFEKHPEHTNMGGTKSGAQIRLEIMNLLEGVPLEELQANITNMPDRQTIDD
tara:strand:- start:135 stop:2318 length:2184 start_codon:yes stop_codon:yes gene_type:complete